MSPDTCKGSSRLLILARPCEEPKATLQFRSNFGDVAIKLDDELDDRVSVVGDVDGSSGTRRSFPNRRVRRRTHVAPGAAAFK